MEITNENEFTGSVGMNVATEREVAEEKVLPDDAGDKKETEAYAGCSVEDESVFAECECSDEIHDLSEATESEICEKNEIQEEAVTLPVDSNTNNQDSLENSCVESDEKPENTDHYEEEIKTVSDKIEGDFSNGQGNSGETQSVYFRDSCLSEKTDNGACEGTENLSRNEDIRVLKREIEKLQSEIRSRNAAFERISSECAEFSDLYPDVSIHSMPDKVWDDIKSGVPMAAAYALYEKKKSVALANAKEQNEKNEALAVGSVGTSFDDSFYSPSEVRKMSVDEVRKNYSKIIDSMHRWN